jgi:hypothetical protein
MVKAKEDDIRHLSDLKQKVHEAQTPADLARASHELKAAAAQNGELNARRQEMKDRRAEFLRANPDAARPRPDPVEMSTRGAFDPRIARGRRP